MPFLPTAAIDQKDAIATNDLQPITNSLLSITHYLFAVFVLQNLNEVLGLANALMWPSIFPLAIDGLGKFTKTGAALLIMGIAGGALMPLLYSYLKDSGIASNHLAFLICMLPAYGYVFFYAVKGFKKM